MEKLIKEKTDKLNQIVNQIKQLEAEGLMTQGEIRMLNELEANKTKK